MLAAISCGSKMRFQSSRISTGLPNSIALLQASENAPSRSPKMTDAEHVDVAEQEVERGLAVDAAAHDLVDAFAHDLEQRGAHRLGQAGSSMASCSTVTRCERMTGAQIVLAIASPLAIVRSPVPA